MHEAKRIPENEIWPNSLNAMMLCKQLRMSVDLYRFLWFGRLQSLLWRRVQDTSGIDQPGVGVQLKPKAGSVEILDVEIALGGNGLVGKAAAD